MVEESLFRGTINFLNEIGLYDVILPFLLIFTIVFAVLEKTKLFGIGKDGYGNVTTKKNLNAIFALVSAFFVIASTQLVSIVNEVVANVVLLLLLAVCFLLLVGTFYGDEEFKFAEKHKTWLNLFMVLAFLGIALIFLNALDWIEWIIDTTTALGGEWLNTLIFFAILVGSMVFITRDPAPKKKEDE